jgi:hypothetical protein
MVGRKQAGKTGWGAVRMGRKSTLLLGLSFGLENIKHHSGRKAGSLWVAKHVPRNECPASCNGGGGGTQRSAKRALA